MASNKFGPLDQFPAYKEYREKEDLGMLARNRISEEESETYHEI
jgi:hypothetical protein